MKLAWFRAAPPGADSSLDDAGALIVELRARHDITVFTAANAHDFVWMHHRAPYDLCVHELDNTAAHQFIWPYLLHYGGVLRLHTQTLLDSRSAALVREGRTTDYQREVAFNQGWAMLRAPLLASRLVIVPHASTAEALVEQYPEARVRVAPTGLGSDPLHIGGAGVSAREGGLTPIRFGVPDGERLEVIERALQRARDGGASAELMTDASLTRMLQKADVILALRWPTFGEPLTTAIAGMAAGKPVVVYEVETTADWPAFDPQTWQPRGISGGAPIVVSIDPRDEEHSLMLAIRTLAADRELRAQIGRAAHDWWRANATIGHAADAWHTFLIDAASLAPPARPADWPAHLTADGTEGARRILAEFGERVDFL